MSRIGEISLLKFLVIFTICSRYLSHVIIPFERIINESGTEEKDKITELSKYLMKVEISLGTPFQPLKMQVVSRMNYLFTVLEASRTPYFLKFNSSNSSTFYTDGDSVSFDEEDGLEEERRLCYVGITRAKEILYLTNCRSRMLYGKTSENAVSRFIKEIDKDLIDNQNVNDLSLEKPIDKSKMYVEGSNDDISQGDTIEHETLGIGVVVKVDGSLIDVAFKTGIKKLMKNHKSIKKL